MALVNKSAFFTHQKILLEPGSYFHREHSGIDYLSLPLALQHAHNRRLLAQYQLPLSDARTPKLPDVMIEQWVDLPKIAWILGVYLLPTPLPWWVENTRYATLHQQVAGRIKPMPDWEIISPQTLLAAGAAQLIACLTSISPVYSLRLKYMFRPAILCLMKTPVEVVLPWNLIEGACHYVKHT